VCAPCAALAATEPGHTATREALQPAARDTPANAADEEDEIDEDDEIGSDFMTDRSINRQKI